MKYDVAKYNLIYIYAIKDEQHKGLLKIGQASFSSVLSIAQLTDNCPTLNQHAHHRIGQQTKTALVSYELLHTELAVRTIKMRDGSTQIQAFEDHDVHDVLLNSGKTSKKFLESGKPSEWYEVSLEDAKSAIKAVKEGKLSIVATQIPVAVQQAHKAIKLRHEQDENVRYTIEIFKRYDTMLWDCKMRYGKTVTAYELIKRQGYKKVIVITHRPAVEDSWGSDHELMFAGTNHQFIDKTRGSMSYDEAMDSDNDRKLRYLVSSNLPFVYFASIQDLRGSKRVGGKYNKNNGVFDMDWDLLIIDEAHEGTSTDLGDAVIKAIRKPQTKVLSLSGTPYNIMGEYEENKYTWTYVDEQKAKAEWDENHPGEKNPYEELPKMNIFTFDLSEQIPTSYRYVTEDSAFNFREFFRTWTGDIEKDFRKIPEGRTVGDFVYHDDVYQFLTLISQESETSNYPFSNDEYRDMFAHTFWIVPGVKEARALSAMLKDHPRFKDFEVVNIAGDGDEEKPYDEALGLVKSSIKAFPKTITISCGKLTTGVTVREWTGVMMLTGSSATAAAGYMQAIFRVQSPGYINGKQKKNCYVFDFAPDRTLKVIAEVHSVTHKSSRGDDKAKQALGEFINFCPVISIEGTQMRTYDVNEMMRQIKRISVDAAINSGFDDDTIYIADAGMKLTEFDVNILRKLSDVVVPQKKGKKQTEVVVNDTGMTDEQRKIAKKAERKSKKDLTPEEKEALELYKKQKEEQKKMFNLLRAVSIRLPLLFYGADADITEIIHLKDFVNIVDEESWQEFMPNGLKQSLFLDILKYYDEDVVVGAGLRIRKMAKAADELPPTLRAKRIVEIMSKFKNPDKETVLTPWRVVNMHMSDALGGYDFFDVSHRNEVEEPRFVEQGDVSADIFLNPTAKVLEMNSKSGLYPLYLAYSFYMLNVSGAEKDLTLEQAQKIWFDTLDKHIFVLCKTKMARMITIRTLAGYSQKTVHAIYLTKLIEERMKDIPRLANKLTNPATWGLGGNRMKFDAVVGNPPYQIVDGGHGSSSQPVYNIFVEAAESISSNYVSMIMPSRWMTGGKGLDDFRQHMINDTRIRVLHDYLNAAECFSTVQIEGGICYFLWSAINEGPCKMYSHLIDGSIKESERYLNEMNTDILIRDDIIIDILKKVQALSEKSFSEYVLPRNPFGLFDIAPYLVDDTARAQYKVLCRLDNKRAVKNACSDLPVTKNHYLIPEWKVFVSKADGAAGQIGNPIPAKIIGKAELGEPNMVCTETFLAAGPFATREIAENIILYMQTKFFRFLVGVRKNKNMTRDTYAFAPLQDFSGSSDVDWKKSLKEIDEYLYKKYSLSSNEISFIETMIKAMD